MVAAAFLALVLGAPVPDEPKIDPARLVGTWKLTATNRKHVPPSKIEYDFNKDGTYEQRKTLDTGEVRTIRGTYEIRGKNLYVESEYNGKSAKSGSQIVELSETRWVCKFWDGLEVTHERSK